MTKVYSIDVQIWATAYIKADSAEAALAIARDLKDDDIVLDEGLIGASLEVSGKRLDDPELPDVSLSPAMTIQGPDKNATPELAFDIEGDLDLTDREEDTEG